MARLSGVSVRTLHHYHHIGLLVPGLVGGNGYRQYRREELLRLQQILFHRRLGMSLEAIAAVLDAPDFDRLASLREQRRRVSEECDRLGRLITTIDRTIAELEGVSIMNDKELYGGLSTAKQAEYEDDLVVRYGEKVRTQIESGNDFFERSGSEGQQRHLAELADIENALAAEFKAGTAPDHYRVVDLIRRHYDWVSNSWNKPPSADAYAGLGDLYVSHPDFVQRYDRFARGMAGWLCAAMKHYSTEVLSKGGS